MKKILLVATFFSAWFPALGQNGCITQADVNLIKDLVMKGEAEKALKGGEEMLKACKIQDEYYFLVTLACGELNLNAGNYKQALVQLGTALYQYPSLEDLLLPMQAAAAEGMKNYKLKVNIRERMYHLHPDSAEIRYGLISAYNQNGQCKEAKQLLRTAPPDDKGTLLILEGYADWKLKNYVSAQKLLEEFFTGFSSDMDITTPMLLAQVCLAQDKQEDGCKWLKVANDRITQMATDGFLANLTKSEIAELGLGNLQEDYKLMNRLQKKYCN